MEITGVSLCNGRQLLTNRLRVNISATNLNKGMYLNRGQGFIGEVSHNHCGRRVIQGDNGQMSSRLE
eukprot:gnl/Chilomastix_caulleri/4014.p1 GENE.gnl/Chilomastix_caulleri/4014~~gnl/Chilomastix_caulleri/4014.p1  ORF type:complete len:67 (+),score=3.33 gnl/Chilomastix_caulleri/4014:98-298(+)